MNPFLHETAGRPPAAPSGAASRCVSSAPRAPSRGPAPRAGRLPARRLSHLLTAAGLAALTWAGAASAVDLNTATLDQLRGIRGIGPKTAQVILDERARGGRYLSFADLSDRVRGIGPRRAQSLQSAGLTIDGGGTRLSGQGAGVVPAGTVGAGGSAGTVGPGRPPAGKR